MALSGLHVAWGYAGGDGYNSAKQAVFIDGQRSETLAAASTTTQGAQGGGHRRPMARVRVSADSWVAFGKSPDASQVVGSTPDTTRFYVPADGDDHDFYVNAGDKVAWVAA